MGVGVSGPWRAANLALRFVLELAALGAIFAAVTAVNAVALGRG